MPMGKFRRHIPRFGGWQGSVVNLACSKPYKRGLVRGRFCDSILYQAQGDSELSIFKGGRIFGSNLFCHKGFRVGNDREELSCDGHCGNMLIIQTKLGLEGRQDLPGKSLITMQIIVVGRGRSWV